MAVQDLTPQLRTRLSRVERAVGWFVMLATFLIVSGFAFYIYHTAKRKGWFVTKVRYFTLAETGAGLKVGDPVKLMGFDVGEITQIEAQPPGEIFNVYVEFQIRAPYYGYLWSASEGGSKARVTPSDFLGKRFVEVTKATNGVPTYLEMEFHEYTLAEARGLADLPTKVLAQEIRTGDKNDIVVHALRDPLSNELFQKLSDLGMKRILVADRKAPSKSITGIWNDLAGAYLPYTKESKPYWLPPVESPALTERLEGLVHQIEQALPGIFNLTNQVSAVLTNTADLTARAGALTGHMQPVITNLLMITTLLTNGNGALGDWLIPTNTRVQLDQTLAGAHSTLSTVDSNVVVLAASLDKVLENLANITSNLNAQVQSNDQILGRISSAIVHTDEMVQGLKRHWLLRSAFREKATNPPPRKPSLPLKKR
jgi:ABC-type transporter Mla subunit MlaD